MIAGRMSVAGRVWVVALAGFLLAGCSVGPHRRQAMSYVNPLPHEPYPLVEQTTTTALTGALHPLADARPRTRPLQVLAVCAGGVDAAFAAGALVGWSDAGTRPDFDVATGSSSGALVAAFAILGPKYDCKLQALFSNISTRDLFDVRPVRSLVHDRALASAKPVERLFEREFNDEYFADLREAHAQGRRLFVGTTNVETKRLIVWDIGAIASSGRPDAQALVRKVMLATITWPGLLPPVEFEIHEDGQCRREYHIDGGGGAQCFVRFGPTEGWPRPDESAPGWLAGSTLYLVAGGRVYDEPTPAPNRLVGRLTNGVSCLIGSLARANMQQLHTLCLASGMRYQMIALPREYTGSESSVLSITAAEMRQLFGVGRRLTAVGPHWRPTPPGSEPGEETLPRGALGDAVYR